MNKYLVVVNLVLLISACKNVNTASGQNAAPQPAYQHDMHASMPSVAPKAESAVAVAPPKSEPAIIDINVVPEAMKFDITTFSVRAGQKVIININNPDSQQHNFVISKPGTLEKVGAEADAFLRDPNALVKGYVPPSQHIIQATALINSDEGTTLEFTAPVITGDYPFICTFPGHWRMMNGIMKVVE